MNGSHLKFSIVRVIRSQEEGNSPFKYFTKWSFSYLLLTSEKNLRVTLFTCHWLCVCVVCMCVCVLYECVCVPVCVLCVGVGVCVYACTCVHVCYSHSILFSSIIKLLFIPNCKQGQFLASQLIALVTINTQINTHNTHNTYYSWTHQLIGYKQLNQSKMPSFNPPFRHYANTTVWQLTCEHWSKDLCTEMLLSLAVICCKYVWENAMIILNSTFHPLYYVSRVSLMWHKEAQKHNDISWYANLTLSVTEIYYTIYLTSEDY